MTEKKAIIFDLCNVLFHFNPQYQKSEKKFTPLHEGIAVLKACHDATRGDKQNKLFVLSNVSISSFETLRTYHPEVMHLFDGAVIAGDVHWRKPNVHIYKHLLQKYMLDPKDCIFIDDKEVNVLVAKSMGMEGIVFDDPEKVKKQLKQLEAL